MLYLIAGAVIATASSLKWLLRLTGSTNSYVTTSVVDPSGNVYLAGNSNSNFVVTKMSPTGDKIWSKTLTGYSYGGGFAPTGFKYNTVDNYLYFSSGSNLIFKIDPSNGSIIWQKTVTYGSNFVTNDLAFDSTGALYVAGTDNYNTAALVKFDANGTHTWTKTLSNGVFYYITVDGSNNIYVTGDYANPNPISPYTGTPINMLVVKYNTSGTIQWQRTWEVPGRNYSGGIATDSSGNVYARFNANEYFSSSSFNIRAVIVKLNSSGTQQWFKAVYGDDSVRNSRIAVDASGNVYEAVLYVGGLYLLKYNSSGTLQWQRSISNVNTTYSFGVTVDSSYVYWIGKVNGADNSSLVLKVPQDGTGTGTYTVGGSSFAYAASSLTEGMTVYSTVTPTNNTTGSITPSFSNISGSLADSSITTAIVPIP